MSVENINGNIQNDICFNNANKRGREREIKRLRGENAARKPLFIGGGATEMCVCACIRVKHEHRVERESGGKNTNCAILSSLYCFHTHRRRIIMLECRCNKS